MHKEKIETGSIISQINSWPFAFMVSLVVVLILIFKSMWNFVSGLYFPYAYEAIFFPYFMYLLFSFVAYSRGDSVNTTRQFLLLLSVVLLFMPSAYLLMTGQVDVHTAIFGDFNPSLEHMPYASALPVIFYLALLAPIKGFMKYE